MAWASGERRSASSTSTRMPASAKLAARLATLVLLPSPAWAELMRMTWAPVAGAVAAFAVLNLLAVLFGAAVAAWLPAWAVTAAVALLFALFGIQSLRFEEGDDDEEIEEKPGHGIVATTFLMIFLAEFGDKTQIAVAGMGSAADAAPTWVGATLALATTSVLGVYAGRRLLNKLPLRWIHRVSGVFFLLLALLAVLRLLGVF